MNNNNNKKKRVNLALYMIAYNTSHYVDDCSVIKYLDGVREGMGWIPVGDSR